MTRYHMQEHNSWGNTIYWWNFDERRIHGHISPMLKEGDEIVSKMKSGKDFVFKVKKVNQQSNPSDQYFADLEDFDYLENIN